MGKIVDWLLIRSIRQISPFYIYAICVGAVATLIVAAFAEEDDAQGN
jgi:hypothetical protein